MKIGDMVIPESEETHLARISTYGSARRDLFWKHLKLKSGNENDPGSLAATSRAGQMIRTRTITLESGQLHYLIKGSAQVYAAVDSHIMIAGPLHGKLVRKFETGTSPAPQWVIHDLRDYVGHRLHVEFGPVVKNHGNNARAVDQPIAGLLQDLKSRGLLDETLVVWAGEFGRTPFAQGSDGRDHNEFGFFIWMAGGGLKKGMVYGATDEWGYKAVENRLKIHDLHTTMLHLLGIDHTRLTYRFSGRDIRLTDVHGQVVHDILS